MDENQKKTFYKETKYKNYSKFEFLKNPYFSNTKFHFFKNDIAYGYLEEDKFFFKRKIGPSMYFFSNTMNSLSSIDYFVGMTKNGDMSSIPRIRIDGPVSYFLKYNKKNWAWNNKIIPEQEYWNK